MMKIVERLQGRPGALRSLIVGNVVDGYSGLEREIDIPKGSGRVDTWEHKIMHNRDCRRVFPNRGHDVLDLEEKRIYSSLESRNRE